MVCVCVFLSFSLSLSHTHTLSLTHSLYGTLSYRYPAKAVKLLKVAATKDKKEHYHYDLLYSDGDREKAVAEHRMRPVGGEPWGEDVYNIEAGGENTGLHQHHHAHHHHHHSPARSPHTHTHHSSGGKPEADAETPASASKVPWPQALEEVRIQQRVFRCFSVFLPSHARTNLLSLARPDLQRATARSHLERKGAKTGTGGGGGAHGSCIAGTHRRRVGTLLCIV